MVSRNYPFRLLITFGESETILFSGIGEIVFLIKFYPINHDFNKGINFRGARS